MTTFQSVQMLFWNRDAWLVGGRAVAWFEYDNEYNGDWDVVVTDTMPTFDYPYHIGIFGGRKYELPDCTLNVWEFKCIGSYLKQVPLGKQQIAVCLKTKFVLLGGELAQRKYGELQRSVAFVTGVSSD